MVICRILVVAEITVSDFARSLEKGKKCNIGTWAGRMCYKNGVAEKCNNGKDKSSNCFRYIRDGVN